MLYLIGEELGDDGSTSAACTVVGTMVCQTLPKEVVEAVLLRLPAAAQARCRAVCKDWLALLTDLGFLRRNFLHSLLRTTPSPLCGVKFWPTAEILRPVPQLKALKVDLSFLPEVFLSYEAKLHNSSPSGFMCITRFVDEGMHVCVFNPVNQSFKVLPMLEKLGGYHVDLLMGTVTATQSIPSFKVFVCLPDPPPRRRGEEFRVVAIYSSTSGEWKGFFSGPLESIDEKAGTCNGDLYMTVDRRQLVRLSTETGPRYLWHVALPDRVSPCWQQFEFFLIGYRGRLLCGGGGDGVWMLDDAKQDWVEIARECPPELLPPGENGMIRILPCENVQVAGDLVVLFYRYILDREVRNCSVAYDMLRRCWRKVPQTIGEAGDVFQPMPNLRFRV